MNERIQELAEQAEKWIRTTNFEGMPEDEMTYDEIFQKKFALLIVRECARLAIEKQTENDIAGIVSKNPAKDFAYALVEHFGVEE